MKNTLLLLLLIGVRFMSQAGELDSLKLIYKKASNDSLKSRACLVLGDYYENRNVDIAIEWGNKAVKHAKKFKDKLFIVKALNYASSFYKKKGASQLQIKMCLEGLKIAEVNNYMPEQGIITGNIGSAYMDLGQEKEALKWLERSIKLKKLHNSKKSLATTIGNLGSYYFGIEEYENAIKYHQEALDIRIELKDSTRMAINLGNLADCYMELKNYGDARILLYQAYEIRLKNQDLYGITKLYLDFSWLHGKQNQSIKAITYADSAYVNASKFEFIDLKHQSAERLAELYSESNNFKQAFKYQVEAYTLWQILHEEEATADLNDLRTQYETEKVENANLLLTQEGKIKDLDLEKNAVEISNQRIIIGSAIIGLLLLIVLVFYLNRWNKEKKKANEELKEQKNIIELANKEIIGSIQYAKRIQGAILPPISLFNEYFDDSFIFYQPKDVVAGDFYWMQKHGDKILFASADCTGHGVPGAMVSVVCNNALNRTVREYGIIDPGKILDKTREIVIQQFEKGSKEIKDGMDIALCALEGNSLLYAGANNPLWIIRNGELLETKANKQPIGDFDQPLPFTTHQIELEKDDQVYIFSDGFQDQFGGDRGKKYKSGSFKKFLVSISDKPMSLQGELVKKEFNSWKGNLEQIDDVNVIGLRI